MRSFTGYLLLLSLTLSLAGNILAQQPAGVDPVDTVAGQPGCPQIDILDIVKQVLKIKPSGGPESTNKLRAIVVPVIGISPATGFTFGAGGSFSWPMGRKTGTKLSAGVASLYLSTQKQVVLQVKSNIFMDRNDWFIQTDWRLYIYRLPTYVLGTGPEPAPYSSSGDGLNQHPNYPSDEYPLKFDWIKFHNVMSRSIVGHLYAGLGYHLDYHYNIEDLDLDLRGIDQHLTPHFAYSEKHHFNPNKYWSSGLSINLVFDSRDNIINAYRGTYINLSYRYNFTWLGSSRNGSTLWTELRTFFSLSKRNPRHVLAFWVYGSFMTSGEIPFLDLMAVGFDQMNSSGRGYAQGRWRGEDLVYGEMEYRFPISRCSGIVGGVLFANVTTASNRDLGEPLFGYLKPGAGFGLRIMINKNDRTNFLIDFGLGDRSSGLYVQAQEIF